MSEFFFLLSKSTFYWWVSKWLDCIFVCFVLQHTLLCVFQSVFFFFFIWCLWHSLLIASHLEAYMHVHTRLICISYLHLLCQLIFCNIFFLIGEPHFLDFLTPSVVHIRISWIFSYSNAHSFWKCNANESINAKDNRPIPLLPLHWLYRQILKYLLELKENKWISCSTQR